MAKSGILYVVGTPIGNLKDITLRALEVLKQVDGIVCEDTRRTRKLLSHYEIKGKKLFSFFRGKEKTLPIIGTLKEGKNLAFVTDAGTPGIQDPGYILIKESLKHNISIVSVPGPSALTSALSISGFSLDRFVFEGFLPKRPNKCKKRLRELQKVKDSIVFFISVHEKDRVMPLLVEHFGKTRYCMVARELTKVYEEVFRGTLEDANLWVKGKKGEFVVVIEGVY